MTLFSNQFDLRDLIENSLSKELKKNYIHTKSYQEEKALLFSNPREYPMTKLQYALKRNN